MSSFNKKKFVFIETFTNENGKTSGSGFIGVILGLILIAAFISTMVGYFLQIPETLPVMNNILQMIMAVTILLGVRKVSGDYKESKKRVSEFENENQDYQNQDNHNNNQDYQDQDQDQNNQEEGRHRRPPPELG